MNTIFEELNRTWQKNYDDAKKDLLQAMNSFAKLDDGQKQLLISEFVYAERLTAIYSIMRQHLSP
jgi:hypothetical protein